jgi:hypothetical protein
MKTIFSLSPSKSCYSLIWYLFGQENCVMPNGRKSNSKPNTVKKWSATDWEGQFGLTSAHDRRTIIEDDLAEGIAALPPRLFYTTQLSVSPWVLNRPPKQSGQTLLIEASNMGTMANRRFREMTDTVIGKIAQPFDAFKQGQLEDKPNFWAVAAMKNIDKHDLFSPSTVTLA